MQLVRSSYFYRSRKGDDGALRRKLRDLAMARPRYGYRRLQVLLEREGWHVNTKQVYRLYREKNLLVRTKRRRKLAARLRIVPPSPVRINERWGIDFLSDQLSNGQRFRILTVVDLFSRECLCLHASRSIPAEGGQSESSPDEDSLR